jgi:hypothetical protein
MAFRRPDLEKRCDLRVNEYAAYSRRQLLANAAIAASRLPSQVFYAVFEPKGRESDDRGSRRGRAYHLALI